MLDDAIFGGAVWGVPFFGQLGSATSTGTTYPYADCGAGFGSATFGIPYFGEQKDCGATPPVHTYSYPQCGAVFGSATFGVPYFGGLSDCSDAPPVPPIPTPKVARVNNPGAGRPLGRHKARRELPHVVPTERNRQPIDQWQAQKARLIEDEVTAINAENEDIAMVIGTWLTRSR